MAERSMCRAGDLERPRRLASTHAPLPLIRSAVLGVLIGFMACHASEAATLTGPSLSVTAESGEGTVMMNYGWLLAPSTPQVASHRDYTNYDDDCDRDETYDSFCEVEWTWTLSGTAGVQYDVTTTYNVTAKAWYTLIVDDPLDCDFGAIRNALKIRNDDGSGSTWREKKTEEECTTWPAESLQDYTMAVTSTAVATAGVTTGANFSCSTRVESWIHVISEARASTRMDQAQPGVVAQITLSSN